MAHSPTTCILLLLDGLGDRSYAVLDHRTPLQAANTPNLDRLAALGANGLMHCGRQGVALPSEQAHFALFGYQPEEFPGRGYLEALGADIEVNAGETAFLAHLSVLKPESGTLLLLQDRPKISGRKVAPLFSAVTTFSYDNLRFRLIPISGVDAILVLSAPSSRHITDTLPIFEGMPLVEPQPLAGFENDPVTVQTAAGLKAYLVWCHRTLSRHTHNKALAKEGNGPLNGLVTLRPGQKRQLRIFPAGGGSRGFPLPLVLSIRG